LVFILVNELVLVFVLVNELVYFILLNKLVLLIGRLFFSDISVGPVDVMVLRVSLGIEGILLSF